MIFALLFNTRDQTNELRKILFAPPPFIAKEAYKGHMTSLHTSLCAIKTSSQAPLSGGRFIELITVGFFGKATDAFEMTWYAKAHDEMDKLTRAKVLAESTRSLDLSQVGRATAMVMGRASSVPIYNQKICQLSKVSHDQPKYHEINKVSHGDQQHLKPTQVAENQGQRFNPKTITSRNPKHYKPNKVAGVKSQNHILNQVVLDKVNNHAPLGCNHLNSPLINRNKRDAPINMFVNFLSDLPAFENIAMDVIFTASIVGGNSHPDHDWHTSVRLAGRQKQKKEVSNCNVVQSAR